MVALCEGLSAGRPIFRGPRGTGFGLDASGVENTPAVQRRGMSWHRWFGKQTSMICSLESGVLETESLTASTIVQTRKKHPG